MNDELLRAIREEIPKSVKESVNGKIDSLHKKVDDHNKQHELDMLEVRNHINLVQPILDDYQQKEAALKYAKEKGDAIKWLAGLVAAIGGLWIVFVQHNPFR